MALKRVTKTPLTLTNLSAAAFQAQWQPNTEARIIKRPNGTAEQCGVQVSVSLCLCVSVSLCLSVSVSAEQCGVQDPRIVYDAASKYYLMACEELAFHSLSVPHTHTQRERERERERETDRQTDRQTCTRAHSLTLTSACVSDTAYGNPYQRSGEPLTCVQAFTRIVRSQTPEIESSWESVAVTGPPPNGSMWDFDAVSTALLPMPSPPHFAFVGRGPGTMFKSYGSRYTLILAY